MSRLYIGNLDFSISEAAIIKLFSLHGKITRLDYLYQSDGPNKGQPRGYCFLEYEKGEEALKAIKSLDGKEIKGRRMHVKYASETKESNGNTKSTLSRGKKESTLSKIDALERKLAEMESRPLEAIKLSDVEIKSGASSMKRDHKSTHRLKPYDRTKIKTKANMDGL